MSDIKIDLPKGVKASDLVYRTTPKSLSGAKYLAWCEGKGKKVEPRELTLYYTERFGWIVTTLLISASRRAASNRTYGVTLNGQTVCVGAGPHVKRTIRLHLYADRMTDLQPYLDLYNKGLENAHDTRDRISTRRANSRRRSSYF